MRPTCKRVGIIGGGLAGLVSIKELLKEGMEPVCFEKADDIGGTWRYRDDDVYGLPSVMWSTSINHSKEFYFSDFVIPEAWPNYMRHFLLFEFIKDHCNEHGLMKHVTLNSEVVRVEKASDYNETGRWSMSVRNTKNGTITKELFDGVLVSVGQICYPNMGVYPGIEEFTGELIHTHSLKRVDKYFNKKVVVVGQGCSALDAAVEISSLARQVYLSVRTPTWIVSRVGPSGLPVDFAFIRRSLVYFQKIMPLKLFSWIYERFILNPTFNHKRFGIKPKYHFFAHEPAVNDNIASKLLCGAVVLRKDINHFTKTGVVFDGEDQTTEVDAVIMGTGYSWNFDFLEEGVVKFQDGYFNLYKCMYPAHLKFPTLAIIGFVLPHGPGFPIGELQIRWAVHLLANGKSLPTEVKMVREIKRRYKKNKKRFCPQDKVSIRRDYVPYCDEIAKELGVVPNFWKMFFKDPRLFRACIFGPCLPYQYRLVGHHKWEGARDAILTCSKRMQAPLSGGPDGVRKSGM